EEFFRTLSRHALAFPGTPPFNTSFEMSLILLKTPLEVNRFFGLERIHVRFHFIASHRGFRSPGSGITYKNRPPGAPGENEGGNFGM
ncbi:MAG: hypothetical protein PHN85_09115, partial [Kiritimatiellae bacterium]|nr:hypothetical protein [Kiritimatiellia bacterium]